jgi:hypothetical protein
LIESGERFWIPQLSRQFLPLSPGQLEDTGLFNASNFESVERGERGHGGEEGGEGGRSFECWVLSAESALNSSRVCQFFVAILERGSRESGGFQGFSNNQQLTTNN